MSPCGGTQRRADLPMPCLPRTVGEIRMERSRVHLSCACGHLHCSAGWRAAPLKQILGWPGRAATRGWEEDADRECATALETWVALLRSLSLSLQIASAGSLQALPPDCSSLPAASSLAPRSRLTQGHHCKVTKCHRS
jgi:hypothetical protein